MKNELDHKLDLLSVASRRRACLELMDRVRRAYAYIPEQEKPFTTGAIFGQYLVELTEEENKLNAEGQAYDKAKDAELAKDESFPF